MQTFDVAFGPASAPTSLRGSVHLPDDRSDVPGLVLVSGSGPSDRHNGGFFDDLRDHLVGSGLAVLTYDKRGTGDSAGDWTTATVDDLAADARLAVQALRATARVAPGVGVLGHSEGGWVAVRLARQHGDVGHLILSSCPAVSFVDAEVFALTETGVSPADARLAGVLLRVLADAARAGHPVEHGRRLAGQSEHGAGCRALRAAGLVLDATAWSQLAAWGSYDPSDDLATLSAPTLVALGAADPLVPVPASVERYEESARLAGRPQRVAVFPGVNHRLQRSDGARIDLGYLTSITDWTRERATPARART